MWPLNHLIAVGLQRPARYGAKAELTDAEVATAQKAYRAGVRMLAGSDAVYTAFGTNMQELEWLVKIGMSNEQALQAATLMLSLTGVAIVLGIFIAWRITQSVRAPMVRAGAVAQTIASGCSWSPAGRCSSCARVGNTSAETARSNSVEIMRGD